MPALDIPVAFQSVSLGKSTARLGVKCYRENLTLEKAAEAFSNRRLVGKVILGHDGDAPGQGSMWEDAEHQVKGVFDVKGFRTTDEVYSTGLSFSLQDIDVEELAKLSKGSGRLVVDEMTDIPAKEKADTAADDRTTPGTLKAEGPWREVPLTDLFDPTQATWKSLAKAEITTVGELADYTASNKQLVDIEGIGPGKAQAIEDTLLEFWRDNADQVEE